MMRAGVFRRGDESHCFGLARVAHVNHRKTIREHVADKSVALVQNDLHAIKPSALVAARDKTDIFRGGAGWKAAHGSTLECSIKIAEARPAFAEPGLGSQSVVFSPLAGRFRRGLAASPQGPFGLPRSRRSPERWRYRRTPRSSPNCSG